QSQCRLTVKEAKHKEPIVSGTIYFAPPDYHLLVESDRHLSLSSEEPVHYSRPSIDVLFESAADAYGRALLAIILTGTNEDGAHGVRAVCDAGGMALVQTPESAEARVMPEAALAACAEARSMSLDAIADLLQTRAS
ncbi:MAG: chemotaxis protein CheB, partial [Nitrospira sp.]|nr:chemotaxis protein CheB [Nitrospira sp.]